MSSSNEDITSNESKLPVIKEEISLFEQMRRRAAAKQALLNKNVSATATKSTKKVFYKLSLTNEATDETKLKKLEAVAAMKRKAPDLLSSSASSGSSSSSSSSEEEEEADASTSTKKKKKHNLDEAAERKERHEARTKEHAERRENRVEHYREKRAQDALSDPLWIQRGVIIHEHDSIPISELSLHPSLMKHLSSTNMTELLPVQAAVIPTVIRAHAFHNDVVACAPTGSGKTLAYILPILHILAGRILKHIAALIVVPSRDLAQQVHAVTLPFAKTVKLTSLCIYGDRSFASEQAQLVALNGTSKVDLLVATPGRLMDHVASTPHFTLQYIQFLVLDEVDRLLGQNHEWLTTLLSAINTTSNGLFEIDPKTGVFRVDFATNRQKNPVTKLIFSATMTRNARELESLHLHNPCFLTQQETLEATYALPSTLEQRMCVMEADVKPQALMTLLLHGPLKDKQTVVFCNSVEATHRLTRLLQLYLLHKEEDDNKKNVVAEYSSLLPQKVRTATVAAFRIGTIRILVSSDAAARGMDIKGVEAVINYDAPMFAKTYVHRVGRTARANQRGVALTMALGKQVRGFKEMLLQCNGGQTLTKWHLDKKILAIMKQEFHLVLSQLRLVLLAERSNTLKADVGLREQQSIVVNVVAPAGAETKTDDAIIMSDDDSSESSTLSSDSD